MSRPFENILRERRWLVSDRLRIGLAVVLFWIALAIWVDAERASLRDPRFSTGYLLFGAVVFLAAYHWRKRLPTIGLGTSRGWMQAHLGVGWATIGLFLFHVGLRVPTGGLDLLLYGVFGFVAGSGLFGLYLTRSIPRRLSAMRREVIYERIPIERREVASQVNSIVLASVASTDVLANYYRESLGAFFELPRPVAYFLRPNGSERRRLIRKANDLDRFLAEEDRKRRDQIRELIAAKDDLDYQFALQARLKAWLFLHIGSTYGLLIVATYHALMVHAFAGSN